MHLVQIGHNGAIVPFALLTTLHLGPLTIDVFSACVAMAIVVGIVGVRRRSGSVGLDPRIGEGMALFATVVGLVVSHVVDVLAYHPEWIRQDPWVLLRLWGSHSSFAGMLGGIFAVAIYAPRDVSLDVRTRLAYLDTVAYAFPFAWVFGRLGCTFVLDHPGRVTTFPLATSLASPEARVFLRSVYEQAGLGAELPSDAALARLGFHNLGLYELVYTLVVILPITITLGRRTRAPGSGVAIFLLAYAPLRFAADFLRVGDRTYAGLTFGQYAAVVLSVGAAWLLFRGGGPLSPIRSADMPPAPR